MGVDVVTAVHAPHARHLAAVWGSLCAQSRADWRWLVQIDGPHEAVTRALEDCGADRDPRVLVAANGPLLGPAVTRNVALGRAREPLVQNVDADDLLEPRALELLAAALERDPAAGFAVGHARDLLPDGALVGHPLPVRPGPLRRGALVDAWLGPGAGARLPVHPAGVMWRRSLLLAVGGWTALFAMEDTGLLLAASALAPGHLVDSPTLRYRRHPGQFTAQDHKFGGGGAQLAMIRQRLEILRGQPAWVDSSGRRRGTGGG